MSPHPEAFDPARVRDLFNRAAEMPPGARPSFLAQACAGDDRLRREVESLLALEPEAEEFLATRRGDEPPLPPGTRLGPCVVEAVLGQGGCGTVYRAREESTGRRVALKCVRAPTEGLLAGLRREIQALSSISHPGIARILDHGTMEGLPWFTMELVEGEGLRSRLDARNAAPWPPGAALSLARRLCEALAALHGEGIVHRDLKPDNIIVRKDGTPVIVDFGLIAEVPSGESREQLDPSGLLVGTAAYMAPEQAQGGPVDARADIYALGCILYELLTGRRPFEGDTASDVLRMHLSATPEPPSRHRPGLAEEVDRLILDLLAKDPRRRFGHADRLAAELARLGAEPERAAPAGRPYLYRPRLAGREEPLARLRAHLEALRQRRGGIVLLVGESGIGKTRLLSEIGSVAVRAGIMMLSGQGNAIAGAREPLSMLAGPLRAVADHCRARGVERASRILGPYRTLLGRYDEAIGALPVGPADGHAVEPDASAGPNAVFRALEHVFHALSGDRPLLLALDDLHWADALSLLWLDRMAATRFCDGRPVVILGTCRSDEMPLAGPLLRSAHRVELARLDAPALTSMAADMLGQEGAAEETIEILARQSRGNPFLAAEYLRAAVADGSLERDGFGRWRHAEGAVPADVPLPVTFRRVALRRLQTLRDDARSLVAASAVLGRDHGWALPQVSELPEIHFLEASREAVARSVLEETADGLWFTHDWFREIAYGEIPLEARARLHRGAAVAIEATVEGGATPAALGMHWEEAGEPARARAAYLAAGDHAATRYALAEAERCYEGCLRLAPETCPEGAAARLAFGQRVLYVSGRGAEALAMLQRAEKEARALQDRALLARCLNAMGSVKNMLGKVGEADESYREALHIHRTLGDDHGAAQVLGSMASCCAEQGRLDEGEAFLRESIKIHRHLGAEREVAVDIGTLGQIRAVQGRLDEAAALHEESAGLLRHLGERRLEGRAVMMLAVVRFQQGRSGKAAELFHASRQRLHEVGDRRFEGLATMNLATLKVSLEGNAAGLPIFEEAAAIFRDTGDVRFEAFALSNLATAMGDLGDRARARRILRRALPMHRQVKDPRGEGFTLYQLGRFDMAEGRLLRARRLIEGSLPRLDASKDPAVKARARISLARLERWSGRSRLALHHAAEARTLLSSARAAEVLPCIIEEAQIALFEGTDPAALIAEARGMCSEMGGPDPGGEPMACLERAVRARDLGRPLLAGEDSDEPPEGLRRWLARAEGAAFTGA